MPRKITVKVPTSVSYSMLGRSSALSTVGLKLLYALGTTQCRRAPRKILCNHAHAYDDTTGAPIAMMDGAPIGA
ncbi:hypothetical protein VH15_03700 [Corynebacterium ulcerans]|nr:hypothetical protein VH15_03700 [Corynebacterium ulcerans]